MGGQFMEKNRRAVERLFEQVARLQNMSVRGQIKFTCTILMVVMILSGMMLGTVLYETMGDYQATMQTVADIYELDDTLEAWDAAMEEYILNASAHGQQSCEERWKELDRQLRTFYPGELEGSTLALANIRSIYQHTQAEMTDMLTAGSDSERATYYTVLSARKDGMLFLLDQLMRLHITAGVENYPRLISRNLSALVSFFAILLVSFILLIICSMRMIRAVCTPIELLVTDAKRIAEGYYDTPAIAILNDDEMGYLSQVFNNMKRQVSANFKNMERIIELQNLLQDAELKALQAQINPHFLFNVLSVAEEAALCEGANQTVEIVEKISYMLQYSLKCTKQNTTLQEELRMVQAYLFLQEKRFGDRIHITFSIEMDIPPLLIPGMSLQPIVENAIQHGVEKMEQNGIVQVRVRRQTNFIAVTISDNGCGIDPELLAAIRRKENILSRNSTGGIGLVNVCRRMEIFYKQEDLFEIESVPGSGTTVTLRYPLAESEATNVQAVGGGR